MEEELEEVQLEAARLQRESAQLQVGLGGWAGVRKEQGKGHDKQHRGGIESPPVIGGGARGQGQREAWLGRDGDIKASGGLYGANVSL